jgi:hypothetical protein
LSWGYNNEEKLYDDVVYLFGSKFSMQQQQQQQPAEYDLLAVFPGEDEAGTAATKLRKEGFQDDEVHQIPQGLVGSGEFRVHGPDQNRSAQFLQVRRAGPNPAVVTLLAVVCAVVLGALSFAASSAFPKLLTEPLTVIIGVVVGLVIGILLGILRRGRVRGNIGQQSTKIAAPPSQKVLQGALTVVALRFNDPENISRNSRARAILINNHGKIDRSVGRKQ